jgi:hypothetical protein
LPAAQIWHGCRCKPFKAPSQVDVAHDRAAALAARAPVVPVASGSASGFPAYPRARFHQFSSLVSRSLT